MFEIYADGECIYSPRLQVIDPDAYAVTEAQLDRELNHAGSLTFTLPPTNVAYGTIQKLKTIITVKQDGEELWRGRVLHDDRGFYNDREIYCEGELSFLLDSTVRPYSYSGDGVATYFRTLINQHNEQVDANKRFEIGYITVTDPNNYIVRANQNYPSTWEEINNKLLNLLGGYLRVRLQNGTRYLDYVEEYGETCPQTIRFGKNLLDLSDYIDAEAIFTVLIPLGATPEGEEAPSDDPERITIESVNGGRDYIENPEGIAKYGRIVKTMVWDDVTLPENLLRKGRDALAEGDRLTRTLTIDAVDLHKVDVDTSAIRLGDYVPVISEPHGINEHVLCTKVADDLLSPEKQQFTLGNSNKTLTGQQADVGKTVAELQGKAEEQKTALLQAIDDATNMITGNKGGYIRLRPPENPEEILIMDTPDTETARNVWRWNRSGLGFSSNGYNGPFEVAATSDGKIVADFVAAGEMNGNVIKAGTLEADKIFGTIADRTGAARVSYWNLETGEVYIDANKFTLFSSGSSSGQTNIGEYIDAVAKEAADAALKASDVARYIAEFQAQLDGKTESFYQEEMPGFKLVGFDEDGKPIMKLIWTDEQTGFLMDHLGNYIEAPAADGQSGEDAYVLTYYDSTAASHEGDLWRQPSTGKDFIFYAGQWIEQTNPVPDEVYDKIDGKAQIFTAEPTAPYNVGDLWFINDQSEILTCVQARSENEGYDRRDWQKRNKYTDDTKANAADSKAQTANQKAEAAQSAVNALDASLDSSGVFNRLTNNGTMQGIFLEKGKLYINGSIIKAHTISVDQLAAGTLSASNITAGNLTLDGGMKLSGSSGRIELFTGSDGVNQTSGIQISAVASTYSTSKIAVSNKGVGIFSNNGRGLYVSNDSQQVSLSAGTSLRVPVGQAIWIGDTAISSENGSSLDLFSSTIRYNGTPGLTGTYYVLTDVWVTSDGKLGGRKSAFAFVNGALVGYSQ